MMTYNFLETYKIPENVCDGLISYFQKNKEYKHKGHSQKNEKISVDVNFYNISKDKNILNFFENLKVCVQNYVTKYDIKNNLKTHIENNIQYYKPGEGYPELHYERNTSYPNRILVYMLYLNTVTDKGGTEFPYQNVKLSAIKGNLHIWPAEFTHPHKGIISPTQEKYIATGWFELINWYK